MQVWPVTTAALGALLLLGCPAATDSETADAGSMDARATADSGDASPDGAAAGDAPTSDLPDSEQDGAGPDRGGSGDDAGAGDDALVTDARPPGDVAPGDTSSGDTSPGDTSSGDVAPGDVAPGDASPGDTSPGDVAPGDVAPGDVAPGDASPGDTSPGDVAPGDVAPGDVAPGDASPGDVAPGDVAPGDIAPGDITPGDASWGDGSAGDTLALPCEWGAAVPGDTVSMSLTVGGQVRSYELHLPADFDCTPRPVIIGLHGYYGSGAGFQSSTSQMTDRIDELGYIGIFPDGLPMSEKGWKSQVTSFNDVDSHNSDGPDGPTCTDASYDYDVFDNCPPEESQDACNWGTSCADDEGFLRQLITLAVDDWSADPARVFLTGFSQGGQTTQSLAWRMSDVLAAAAPHHGFAANGYTQAPDTPLSLFQVWASDDTVVNGNEAPSSDGMIYDGADETALIWASAQGCDAPTTAYPTSFDGTSGWACAEHAGCASGAQVVSCVWQGGHTWGRVPGINFALESMLSFFANQGL